MLAHNWVLVRGRVWDVERPPDNDSKLSGFRQVENVASKRFGQVVEPGKNGEFYKCKILKTYTKFTTYLGSNNIAPIFKSSLLLLSPSEHFYQLDIYSLLPSSQGRPCEFLTYFKLEKILNNISWFAAQNQIYPESISILLNLLIIFVHFKFKSILDSRFDSRSY